MQLRPAPLKLEFSFKMQIVCPPSFTTSILSLPPSPPSTSSPKTTDKPTNQKKKEKWSPSPASSSSHASPSPAWPGCRPQAPTPGCSRSSRAASPKLPTRRLRRCSRRRRRRRWRRAAGSPRGATGSAAAAAGGATAATAAAEAGTRLRDTPGIPGAQTPLDRAAATPPPQALTLAIVLEAAGTPGAPAGPSPAKRAPLLRVEKEVESEQRENKTKKATERGKTKKLYRNTHTTTRPFFFTISAPRVSSSLL